MRSPNFLLAETLLGTDLKGWIEDRKKVPGRSFDSIARELWQETGGKVDVTGWSIRRWVTEEKVG